MIRAVVVKPSVETRVLEDGNGGQILVIDESAYKRGLAAAGKVLARVPGGAGK